MKNQIYFITGMMNAILFSATMAHAAIKIGDASANGLFCAVETQNQLIDSFKLNVARLPSDSKIRVLAENCENQQNIDFTNCISEKLGYADTKAALATYLSDSKKFRQQLTQKGFVESDIILSETLFPREQ